MNTFTSCSDLEIAINVVKEACRLATEIQNNLAGQLALKEDRSPVTVADFSVQALVARRLEEAQPDVPVVGEEDGRFFEELERDMRQRVLHYVGKYITRVNEPLVTSWIDRGGAEPGEKFWVIDPIDGTKGFLRGGQFAVALALIEKGSVKVGVLGCPRLKISQLDEPGVLVYAAAGQGTWAAPLGDAGSAIQVRVSECASFEGARMLFSYEAAHTKEDSVFQFMKNTGMMSEPVRIDSQAKQALLACGDGEFIVRIPPDNNPDYKEKIWDQAAGMIVILEAGGRVTDLGGKDLDFTAGRKLARNTGIFSSNGILHDAGLEKFRTIQRSGKDEFESEGRYGMA